jgi:phospholipid transport system transporter-binding protein
MSGEASLSFSDDAMQLRGVVDFASVVALQGQGDAWLRGRAPALCRLDMGGVTRSNSAGTALMLAWLRTARAAGKRLIVQNPPENLVALMQLAGLESVLRDSVAATGI